MCLGFEVGSGMFEGRDLPVQARWARVVNLLSAFLARIWQTMGTPAINAEVSQSHWRPVTQAFFFGGC